MSQANGKVLRILASALLAGAAHAQLPDVADAGHAPTCRSPCPRYSCPVATLASGGCRRPHAAPAADARVLRIEQMSRDHRAELERDPAGELVVRAEVVAIDITEAALQRALENKFLLKRTQELAELGVKITVLQTPEGWTARRGLKGLRKLDPEGTYDYNHVYLDGGAAAAPAAGGCRIAPHGARGSRARRPHRRRRGRRTPGASRTFVCSASAAAAASCPTRTARRSRPSSPTARVGASEIFAADVYCGEPTGGAIDAVAAALGWLAREKVGVINISLVGPRNALLERVVSTLVARGYLIVAAVGNDGPAAPPLYPAAYAAWSASPAVDGNHSVLVEACRGKHVDFAARGADMNVATQAPDVYAPVRGTSFAAPLVAALLVTDMASPDAGARERAIAKWRGVAQDLGKRGRDDMYGAGELGEVREAVAEKTNK